MRVIGVTGGVGAGKSTVLGIMEEDFQAYVIQADQLGHILMEPGEECYDAVIALFGKEIIKKDKTIDRRRISDVVFTDKEESSKYDQHQWRRKALCQNDFYILFGTGFLFVLDSA